MEADFKDLPPLEWKSVRGEQFRMYIENDVVWLSDEQSDFGICYADSARALRDFLTCALGDEK